MSEQRLQPVPPQEDHLTVEELAARTGMTVRNIRNHQSRGLLPPPDVIARTGYYRPEHVERLKLIREMQADGFNLQAIARLLTGAHGAAEQIIGLRRAMTAPARESPEILTSAELEERFGAPDPRLLAKAVKLELVVPLGEDRFEVPSPAVLRAAEQVIRRGMPLRSALDVVEQVRRHCEAVSRAFVRLFLEELWRPVADSGEAERRWPEVAEAVQALRPLATEVVDALLEQTLAAEVERAFARELERRAKR